MRPKSSNLPKVQLPSVGVVLTGQAIRQEAHQVLEHFLHGFFGL
jgi:hypothetical protein